MAGQFEGGGFMPSQATQSAEPGLSPAKNREAQTLLPLTVKQITDGVQSYGKSDIQIDGVDVHTVKIVGMIVHKEEKVTDVTFVIDDGTGRVECQIWPDGPADTNQIEMLQNGMYVVVHGKLNVFQEKRKLTVFSIRPVKDYDEIAYHFANCIYVHCYNTRLLKMQDAGNVPSHMSNVQTMQGVGQVPGRLSNSAFNTPSKGYQSMPANNYSVNDDPLTKLVKDFLAQPSSPDRDVMGYHVREIAEHLKMPEQKISEIVARLVDDGVAYSTVDEFYFKSTANC